MRRPVVALLLAVAALLGGRFALDDAAAPLEGRVTRVVDGDTLHVQLGGRDETVRMLGIDTPELHRPGTPVECGARAAAAALQRLALGRAVTVRADAGQDERDRYGRLLAYVETADGRDLGESIVAAGWAEVYVFDSDPFARVRRYRAAARRARSAELGVLRRCAGDFHSGILSPMPENYTHKKLTDVEDSAAGTGMGEIQEARFATEALGAEDTGFSLHRLNPGKRQAFGHRHENAEEVYVVIGGSGRAKVEDDVLELERLDALRLAPGAMRAFEGGPEGLELLAFGPRHQGDGEMEQGWWVD